MAMPLQSPSSRLLKHGEFLSSIWMIGMSIKFADAGTFIGIVNEAEFVIGGDSLNFFGLAEGSEFTHLFANQFSLAIILQPVLPEVAATGAVLAADNGKDGCILFSGVESDTHGLAFRIFLAGEDWEVGQVADAFPGNYSKYSQAVCVALGSDGDVHLADTEFKAVGHINVVGAVNVRDRHQHRTVEPIDHNCAVWSSHFGRLERPFGQYR